MRCDLLKFAELRVNKVKGRGKQLSKGQKFGSVLPLVSWVRVRLFYVRDKNPADISEACTLYERYLALIDNETHKKAGMKGVSNARTNPEPAEPSSLSCQVTEAIERMTLVANQQMQKLAEAMSRLQTPPAHAPPHASTAPPASAAAQPTHPAHPPAAPSTPCPRGGQIGH